MKTVEEYLQILGNPYDVTVTQWRDEWGHWRVGLNWDTHTSDHLFLVEKPTLQEALHFCWLFHTKKL